MTPKAEGSVVIGTKVPESKKREITDIANRKGLKVSDNRRLAIYKFIADEGDGGDESVNDQLAEHMMRCRMDLCPVLRNIRANSKPRDARPPQEEGVTRP